MRIGEVGFRVRVTSYLIAHCGPMLKISWRSIKIWLRFIFGLNRAALGVKCLRPGEEREYRGQREREELDFRTCLALPCHW